jgi:hypothetical protein
MKNFLKLSLFLAALFLIFSSPAAFANLLVNGGAEDGILEPWTADTSYSVATSGNGFTPYDGNYFFYIYLGEDEDWLRQTSTNGLIVGQTLQLIGVCATDSVDYGEATLSIYDSGNNLLSSKSTTEPLVGEDREWVPFSLNLAVPDDAYSWQVDLVAKRGTSGFYVDVNWDSVSLEPIPIPAAVWLLFSGLLGLGAARRRFK